MNKQAENVKTYHYKTFKEFYPFYLKEHNNVVNKSLHILGAGLFLIIFLLTLLTQKYRYFILCPIFGYGLAWIGHFVFQKNKPATFKYPFFSFVGDFRMFFETITGLRKF